MRARRRPVTAVALGVLAVLLTAAAGCASDGDGDDGASSGSGPTGSAARDELVVVTTVSPITSIASAVIGDSARVVGIVPEGTNSHTFEPEPSVAALLTEADVVLLNGLQLEEPTRELAEATVGDDVEIVALGDEVTTPDEWRYDFSFPEDEGKPNPHLWTDPALALDYAGVVRDVMVDLDPAGADGYEERYGAFAAEVAELDEAMVAAFATIPEGQRTLLTYHDAYAYFAENYGFEVVGAIQPADMGAPTARDVAALIEQVRDRQVPAVFGSEVFPSPVLDQIAEEAGVAWVATLRDDDLPGQPGDPEHSWLGLMRSNYVTMTEALGGDPTPLVDLALPTDVIDSAEYPQ